MDADCDNAVSHASSSNLRLRASTMESEFSDVRYFAFLGRVVPFHRSDYCESEVLSSGALGSSHHAMTFCKTNLIRRP